MKHFLDESPEEFAKSLFIDLKKAQVVRPHRKKSGQKVRCYTRPRVEKSRPSVFEVRAAMRIGGNVFDLRKAIFTASRESKDAKESKAVAAPKKSTKATSVQQKGGQKAHYEYPQDSMRNKPSGKSGKPQKAPGDDLKFNPDKGSVKPPDPVKLAKLLRLKIEDLQKLAKQYDTRQFVAYFKTNCRDLLKKYHVPSSYLEMVHEVLVKQ